jgi:hypothetical protein
MSLPEPTPEPCLMCGPAGTPEVRTAPSPYDLTPLTDVAGWAVTCSVCGIRSPWRPTRAQAIGAWNRHVTTLAPTPVPEMTDPATTKE